MLSFTNIQPFDYLHASQSEYAALNRHENLLRRERLPDDPPITLEETYQELQHIPAYIELKFWCAWDSDHREIIAESYLQLFRTEENQHLAPFDITVQPSCRRQGLGRQLLDLITTSAHAENRRLLIAQTYDRVPAGEAFMTRLEAQKGLESHINQLRIADLDQDMLHRWLQLGQNQATEFELGLWDGPYPQEQLPAISHLVELTNQVPFGDLEIEDMHPTPEQLRQMEQLIFSRGGQRWTFYIIERSTGKFVGYTETVWNPNRPEILNQDMTGVFPEYRGKGLGRWLKAAMLDKVLVERPQVKYIRTGNADVNAAMLKINTDLGFRPYMANVLWQLEVEHILAYLGRI